MLRRATFALAFLAALACSKAASPAKKGAVVAQGGGITVTADELKARLDEQSPMIRAGFNNLDRKKQFLDNMLRFELLARAAEKEGLANDPEVQFAMRRMMVQKYYQRFFQDDKGAKAVPDAEVQKYYDEHKDDYHRPARIHVAHIFLKAAEGSSERAKKAAEAKKLLAKVLADEKKNAGAFALEARNSSEDTATKSLGGDLALKTRDELAKTYGDAFAEASSKLPDNQISPAVIGTPQGFHLIRALGRQPEVNKSLEDVKGQITARLSSQRKTKEFDDFVKKLRDEASIKVNDAELEKVVVTGPAGMGAPNVMGAGPGVTAAPAPAAPPAPATSAPPKKSP